MNIRDIIPHYFENLKVEDLPSWLESNINQGDMKLNSYIWKSDKVRKIRVCELTIPGKFLAETLVVYPNFEFDTPIFGTEYMSIGNKKYFGAIDFHPLKNEKEYQEKYISTYLGDFEDHCRSSKIYDLNKHFSKKLWLKKDTVDFYHHYLEYVEKYLSRFLICLEESKQNNFSSIEYQKSYDNHLSLTDPAYGILKSHFNKEFAKKYIGSFLFDLGDFSNI